MSSPPTQQQTVADTDHTPRSEPAPIPEPVIAPPKQQRRPALIGLGVALVALGGLGAAWLATSVSDTQGVIALRNDISRGEIIDAGDLVTATINDDPNLAAVSTSDASEIIGQHARVDMAAGSLLTRDAVTSTIAPADGEAMVGVAVTATQLPSEELVPGDTIRIVSTPPVGGDAPTDTPPSIEATVIRSTVDDETGQRVVDVVLPDDQAPELAAQVATGRIVIVLQSRGEES